MSCITLLKLREWICEPKREGGRRTVPEPVVAGLHHLRCEPSQCLAGSLDTQAEQWMLANGQPHRAGIVGCR